MATNRTMQPQTHSDYTIGWICTYPEELTAAMAMLDKTYQYDKHGVRKPENDQNTYTFGSIMGHNVVLAALPKGASGNDSTSAVAIQMASTFPSIRSFFFVGIGGGVPPQVRLGDVVVGTPVETYSGIVQWDMGETTEGGFKRSGALNAPPASLLTVLSSIEAKHLLNESKIPSYLEKMGINYPGTASKYLETNKLEDVLFRPDYSHVPSQEADLNPDNFENNESENCRNCDRKEVVKRRPDRKWKVHYGLIASGNQVRRPPYFSAKRLCATVC
ncbi:hypothetical protein ABW20_dc0104067 [Dactylellina cionopaga]|nr:hypothetical protein ABW20_dc0104067 [Dactylellina cionopaga]